MFSCKNGQCVDLLLICDGLADCLDKSDEIQSLCAPMNKTYGKITHSILFDV